MLRRCFALLAAMGVWAGPSLALSADYEIHFEGLWTADLPRPGSAHFTHFVGATHNADGSLLAIGQAASPGVESVAEVGGTFTLRNEVQQQIDAGHADQVVLGDDTFLSPLETDTFTIKVDDQFPLLTLISMIAPSPDWFLGVQDLSMLDAQGNFLPQLVVDLPSYDAGTENGDQLSLSNPATNPQGVITPLDTAEPNNPFFGADPLGRLTITRVLPADLSGDGDVDDEDLGQFFSAFTGPDLSQGTLTNPAADLSGDGDVDDEDLGLAFAGFTGPLAPASVPEPGTLAGLTLLGLLLVARQRPTGSG